MPLKLNKFNCDSKELYNLSIEQWLSHQTMIILFRGENKEPENIRSKVKLFQFWILVGTILTLKKTKKCCHI